MASAKQTAAAKKNIKKAAKARKTLSKLPKKVRTALGEKGGGSGEEETQQRLRGWVLHSVESVL